MPHRAKEILGSGRLGPGSQEVPEGQMCVCVCVGDTRQFPLLEPCVCFSFHAFQSLSHVRLCNPMDCSMPGFLVLHCVRICSNLHPLRWLKPSKHLILWRSLLLLPSICPSIRVFSNESAFTLGGQNSGASASASVLPMNI